MDESIGKDAGGDGRRGRCVTEKTVNGRYRWRLKAPNGRTVAVSSAQYRTAEAATQAFATLRAEDVGQLARFTHIKEGLGWAWMIPGPKELPLARSVRAYERYATCQNAFRKFIALLASETGVTTDTAHRSAVRAGTSAEPEPPGAGDAARS